MIGMVWSALGLGKYAMIAIVAAGAYWYVWNTGRGFERSRWEAATVVELDRQAKINDNARVASEAAAEELLASEDDRRSLLRRLSNEALQDAHADDACLRPSGVLRLNSVGSETDTD